VIRNQELGVRGSPLVTDHQSLETYSIHGGPNKIDHGEVPERPNGAVSKTVVGLVPTVGSNPTLSAGSKKTSGDKATREVFLLSITTHTTKHNPRYR
jgi:hypothetical protein